MDWSRVPNVWTLYTFFPSPQSILSSVEYALYVAVHFVCFLVDMRVDILKYSFLVSLNHGSGFPLHRLSFQFIWHHFSFCLHRKITKKKKEMTTKWCFPKITKKRMIETAIIFQSIWVLWNMLANIELNSFFCTNLTHIWMVYFVFVVTFEYMLLYSASSRSEAKRTFKQLNFEMNWNSNRNRTTLKLLRNWVQAPVPSFFFAFLQKHRIEKMKIQLCRRIFWN